MADIDLTTSDETDRTQVGGYFVANYPPFSAWSDAHVPDALATLDRPAAKHHEGHAIPPLGLYLHIPFCRKRCKFCYFRVYTDKNSNDVETYLTALSQELALYAQSPAVQGRKLEFAYFGGGTPSFLSKEQLVRLVEAINTHWRWDEAREVTFECEPGTLQQGKLEAIKAIGVTRLSLGVEHFDDEILTINGRAHKSPEILRSYDWAREADFDQINVDLIAGMLGETQSKWKDTVEKTLELDPDSVTIYQMEIPPNSTLAREARATGGRTPIASWQSKRRWVDYAFTQFEEAGYRVSSAYTLSKSKNRDDFVYRDAVWRGADLMGSGVASFSHVGGVHFQNFDQWDDYVDALARGQFPLARAFPMTDHQKLIRELALQLKLGGVDARYFREKFGAEIHDVFADAIGSLTQQGFAEIDGDTLRLTRAGLLRVDALLPAFYESIFRRDGTS